MSPVALEEKIARVSPPYRQELIDFIDFILYRQDHDGKPFADTFGMPPEEQLASIPDDLPNKRGGKRASLFGALKDDNFYMALDFDAPLDCFKDYM